jgi:hypothetical protein
LKYRVHSADRSISRQLRAVRAPEAPPELSERSRSAGNILVHTKTLRSAARALRDAGYGELAEELEAVARGAGASTSVIGPSVYANGGIRMLRGSAWTANT